jgi:hypothetical protein
MNFTPVLEDACIGATFCIIFWIVFISITRHLTARSYNSMQEKVFEKLNATPAIAELVSSGALQPFLQSLTPEKTEPTSTSARILRGIQAGILLTCFGIAMLFLHQVLHNDESGLGFLVTGIGAIGLGLGFVIAALSSIWLSRQLGLLDREPRA